MSSGHIDHAANAQHAEGERRSSIGNDNAFTTVYPDSVPEQSTLQPDTRGKKDPTLIQNQVSVMRKPSVVRSPLASSVQSPSPLARALSVKSNASYDADLSQSSILSVLSYDEDQPSLSDVDERSLGCEKSGGVVRSSTSATARSTRSIAASERSVRSVQSVAAVGAYPIGSLRVHDQETIAQNNLTSPECLSSGDVVVVTGVPPESFFGIDTLGLEIGKDGSFSGVRDIPSGAHFIYGGSSSVLSTRNGFWIMSKQRASGERGDIHVKRWDKETETIEEEVSVAEVRIQKENVPQIFEGLLPYTSSESKNEIRTKKERPQPAAGKPANESKIWPRLTSHIKGAMLTRITGHEWNSWQIASTDDYKPMVNKVRDSRSNSLMDAAKEKYDQLEHLTAKDRVLKFAFPQNATTFTSKVTGRQRTEQAMDTSAHVMAVIMDRCTYEDEDEVVGELQFCFVSGMLLGNMACMEQWAWVLKVVFKAFRLALDKPVLFQKIIEAVHAQLIYNEDGVEGSIFDHDPNLEDDLKMALTIFKSRLNEQLLEKGQTLTKEQQAVGQAFEALESWLWKWGWDLRGNYLRSGKIQLETGEFVDAEMADFEDEDERGEFAPVLVEVDEQGMEKGLIRF